MTRMPRRAALRRIAGLPLLGSSLLVGCSGSGSGTPASSPASGPEPASTKGPTLGSPPAQQTTRAVWIEDYVDDLARLDPVEVPVVPPGAGEVRVRVQANALNPVDVGIALGRLRGIAPPSFPAVLGWDLAGIVDAVGPEVKGFARGDEVYAAMGFAGGAFTQLAIVPAQKLAKAPTRVDPLRRAALPLVALTTVQAMRLADLQPGGKVLVLGGPGGVGSIAIQWLRHFGAARIVATASETKLETVRGLGADEVIDYRNDDWAQRLAGQDFDVVYDTVGDKDAATRATKVLREGGHYIAIASRPGDVSAFGDRFHFHFHVVQPSGDDLRLVTDAVQAGGIEPLIFEEFAFDRMADAYARCAERVAVGKIVVAV